MVQPNPPSSDVEFDEDFKPDERLFHYTSSQGLFGILESECFWATHFKFLNDSNEFIAARKSLTKFVELEIRKKIAALKVSGTISLNDGVSIKDLSEHEADAIIGAMYTATLENSEPFIFSTFVSDSHSESFRDGELLHWATYGRDGGYALEINPHKLAKFILGKKENLLCQRAVYVKDGVPPELQKEYAIIGKLAQDMIVGMLTDNLAGVPIEVGAPPFMRVASVIKDAFFKNEKEARIAAMRLRKAHGKYSPPPIFIRHQNGRAIPYIKLFEKILSAEHCPIETIIIGPHPDKERRHEALALFLDARGLNKIQIHQSQVPYLGS